MANNCPMFGSRLSPLLYLFSLSSCPKKSCDLCCINIQQWLCCGCGATSILDGIIVPDFVCFKLISLQHCNNYHSLLQAVQSFLEQIYHHTQSVSHLIPSHPSVLQHIAGCNSESYFPLTEACIWGSCGAREQGKNNPRFKSICRQLNRVCTTRDNMGALLNSRAFNEGFI